MPVEATGRGLAILCDVTGIVRQVLRDDLNLGPRLAPDVALIEIVDPSSRGKTLSFLAELRANGTALDWELTLTLDGRPDTLHFAGLVLGKDAWVVGARSRLEIPQLYEGLIGVNNEQANALRAAVKKQMSDGARRNEHDATTFADIARLNNELGALQRELARKNAQLERLVEQQNQFIGMAAHDLRNPLSVIQAMSQFLLNDPRGAPTERQAELLATVHRNSEFMFRLIEDLLDVSKIQAGKLELDRVPTDLAALVARSVALNQVLAERKQIRIDLVTDPALPPVEIDVAKLEQVLNNLISNAVKFSPQGSSVEVRLDGSGDQVLLTVRDHGQGIQESEIGKLFRPFGKTSTKGTAGEKSTGLGLVICKRIVEGHGGTIDVETRFGEGALFRVVLPTVALPIVAAPDGA